MNGGNSIGLNALVQIFPRSHLMSVYSVGGMSVFRFLRRILVMLFVTLKVNGIMH